MCYTMAVSRSGYYHWLNRKESRCSIERKYLTAEIRAIFNQSKGRYGSPKNISGIKSQWF